MQIEYLIGKRLITLPDFISVFFFTLFIYMGKYYFKLTAKTNAR